MQAVSVGFVSTNSIQIHFWASHASKVLHTEQGWHDKRVYQVMAGLHSCGKQLCYIPLMRLNVALEIGVKVEESEAMNAHCS
jgi:hypothetical protein